MTTATKPALSANVQSFSQKARVQMTRSNLYYAGIVLLVLVNLYLLVQMALAWNTASSQSPQALEQQTVAMKTAEIATKPLEGLDRKLTTATADADGFYARRLPSAYSEVVAELGALAKQQGVKLTRVQYADSPMLDSATGALTEVRMDASLNGDYRPLVLFINSLERDKIFFLIRGVTLTGQETGMVGLRLALTTYLRPGKSPAPPVGSRNTSASDTSNGGGAR
jgi:type IV pilus assembly protein PilO